jgi:hypothetical protein
MWGQLSESGSLQLLKVAGIDRLIIVRIGWGVHGAQFQRCERRERVKLWWPHRLPLFEDGVLHPAHAAGAKWGQIVVERGK